MLEELHDAIDSLFFSPPSAPTNGKNTITATAVDEDEDENDGEAAEPISVLIDLLVSLLQRPSVLLRTVAERVFAAYSGEVKEQALGLLLDQITPDDQVEGQDDEEDSEADDGEDEENAVKKIKNNEEADDDDDSEDDDEDDDDEDEDDDDDLGIDLDADPELRAKVEAALRSAGIAESEDEDEEEEEDNAAGEEQEEEELLDDDQMMQLDEQLAEIFRAKKAANKENKGA